MPCPVVWTLYQLLDTSTDDGLAWWAQVVDALVQILNLLPKDVLEGPQDALDSTDDPLPELVDLLGALWVSSAYSTRQEGHSLMSLAHRV